MPVFLLREILIFLRAWEQRRLSRTTIHLLFWVANKILQSGTSVLVVCCCLFCFGLVVGFGWVGWLVDCFFSPCHSRGACAVRLCPQQGARVPRCSAGPSRGRSRLPPCPRAAAAAPSALPGARVVPPPSPGGGVGVGVSPRGTPLTMAVSGGARSRCDPSSRQPGSQSGPGCWREREGPSWAVRLPQDPGARPTAPGARWVNPRAPSTIPAVVASGLGSLTPLTVHLVTFNKRYCSCPHWHVDQGRCVGDRKNRGINLTVFIWAFILPIFCMATVNCLSFSIYFT